MNTFLLKNQNGIARILFSFEFFQLNFFHFSINFVNIVCLDQR